MAVMITLVGTEQYGLELPQILAIVVPASLLGVVACSLAMARKGKELADDEEVQRRIAAGELRPPVGTESAAHDPLAAAGRPSALIFLGGIVFVVLVGLIDDLRPQVPTGDGGTEPVSMSTVIQLVMLTVAVLIVVLQRVKPADLARQDVFGAGITALIALFGVAWLADTYVSAHLDAITRTLSGTVEDHPVTFALALGIVAALTTSQPRPPRPSSRSGWPSACRPRRSPGCGRRAAPRSSCPRPARRSPRCSSTSPAPRRSARPARWGCSPRPHRSGRSPSRPARSWGQPGRPNDGIHLGSDRGPAVWSIDAHHHSRCDG